MTDPGHDTHPETRPRHASSPPARPYGLHAIDDDDFLTRMAPAFALLIVLTVVVPLAIIGVLMWHWL